MRTRGWMALALLAALALAGCSTGASAPSANPTITLGTQFQLAAGKTATLPQDNTRITFAGVSEDSRCPSGVQCAWAGQARVQFTVDPAGGAPSSITLTLGGATQGSDSTSIGPYVIRLRGLDPLPVEDAATKSGDYVAALLMTRK